MVTRRLFGSALHEHADPAQRILGVAELRPGLGRAGAGSSAPIPRRRSAPRRRALRRPRRARRGLGDRGGTGGARGARACAGRRARGDRRRRTRGDAPRRRPLHRRDPRRRGPAHAGRRNAAAARSPAIRDEAPLVELALTAEHAETRMAAAEARAHAGRVAQARRRREEQGSRRGAARAAADRCDRAIARARPPRPTRSSTQLEALATRPGPILTAVIELNRRWQALDIGRRCGRIARVRRGAPGAAGALRPRARGTAHAGAVRAAAARMARRRGSARTAGRARGTLPAELAALRDEAPKYADDAALSAARRGRTAHRALGAGAAGAGRRRSAGRRGRAARRRHVDRQREAAGALAGARSRDTHARADAALRGRADRRSSSAGWRRSAPRSRKRAPRGSRCTPCCTPPSRRSPPASCRRRARPPTRSGRLKADAGVAAEADACSA